MSEFSSVQGRFVSREVVTCSNSSQIICSAGQEPELIRSLNFIINSYDKIGIV